MTSTTCSYALPVLGAALMLSLATGAFAQSEEPMISAGDQATTTGTRDDIFPPWWRGDAGTTFQHWTFDSDQAPHWVPEDYDNPYGEPWMDTQYHDEEWYSYWEGRGGVVQPWDNTVYLNLPNSAEPLDWKIVWIQLTWRHGTGELIPPEFLGADPPGELVWAQYIPLGDGWWHTVYEIWIPENPEFEKITIDSDHYFDQIVVDTWCSPLEPRGACCVDGECVGTMSCLNCLLLDGWWYQGEDCSGDPPFQCPCRDALWHNGEPDFYDSLACSREPGDVPTAWVVDDVTFEQDIMIRDLHWWAQTGDLFNWQHTGDIIILASDGPDGGPGTVLIEMWDTDNIRYDSCQDYVNNLYMYSVDGLEIPLPAGTYWIGARPVNQGTNGQSYNMTSAHGDPVGQECYFKSEYFGYPDWTPGHEVFNGMFYDIAFCVTGAGEPCPADFDGDGDIDTADLLHLLGCWGEACGDVDGDGDTDTADLLALLGAWGECP